MCVCVVSEYIYLTVCVARVHVITCVTPNYPTTTPVMSIVIEPSDKQQEVYGIQHKVITLHVTLSDYRLVF